MGDQTNIEYADYTFNPWIGCQHAPDHPGCRHCYAERLAKRLSVTWGRNGIRRRTSDAYWRKPLTWDRKAAKAGKKSLVLASWCDPFEDWDGSVYDHHGHKLIMDAPGDITGRHAVTLAEVRHAYMRLIDQTQNLIWLLLTKRPENVRRLIPGRARCAAWPHCTHPECIADHYYENVWLGASISDQATADRLIPELLKLRELTPCLFLSIEPLLGPIDLRNWFFEPTGKFRTRAGERQYQMKATSKIDWLIVGGESGPKARPCHLDWIRGLVQQCKDAGVPCFVKQLGANPHRSLTAAGYVVSSEMPDSVPCGINHLKGGDPSEWPEDLRVQEYPEAASHAS